MKPKPDYSDLISAAEQRHRDRMSEAKAALVDEQWAAAAEYNITGSFRAAKTALHAAMEAADAKYAAAVAESLAMRKKELEEAWNAQSGLGGETQRS